MLYLYPSRLNAVNGGGWKGGGEAILCGGVYIEPFIGVLPASGVLRGEECLGDERPRRKEVGGSLERRRRIPETATPTGYPKYEELLGVWVLLEIDSAASGVTGCEAVLGSDEDMRRSMVSIENLQRCWK